MSTLNLPSLSDRRLFLKLCTVFEIIHNLQVFLLPENLDCSLTGRLAQVTTTREEKSTTYLIQRLAVAVQRGNAASVLSTAGHMTPSDFF